MTQLSIIVAMAKNRAIGRDNTLPWHLPEDLRRFKSLTMGHHIVMGRNTYASLGRLLPGRTTVVMSQNPTFAITGAKVLRHIDEVSQLCELDDEVFVIGGAQIYALALPLADKIYLTEIDIEVTDADTFFPDLDEKIWQLESESSHVSAEGLVFRYKKLVRRTEG